MRFSLTPPTITFETERKYTITIAANDTTQYKAPVFETGPPEAVLLWRKRFEELSALKEFTAAQKIYQCIITIIW